MSLLDRSHSRQHISLDPMDLARQKLRAEQNKKQPNLAYEHQKRILTMHYHLSMISNQTFNKILDDLSELEYMIESNPEFDKLDRDNYKKGYLNDLIAINQKFQERARRLNSFVQSRYDGKIKIQK